jgi:signal transduction histidine kinase
MLRAGVPLPPILRLSRALHGAEDLERILDRVRDFLTETTRYRWVYVHLFHPSGSKMEIAGWVLPQPEKIRANLELVDVERDPFLQRVLYAQELLVVDDLRLEPDADQAQVEAAGIRTAFAAPLFDGDSHLGPLVVCTFADQGVMPPTPEELDLVSQVAAIVGTVITRVRARAAQLLAETRLARAAKAEALGRMAGEVAHDFNNVLVAIIANLDLARSELQGHPVCAYLDDALTASDRATKLTRQLLATSRGQPLSRRSISLGDVLERACKLVSPTFGPAQTLERAATPDMPVVAGDPELLERVFVNLLVNARDAIGPSGRISVEVRTVHVDADYVAAREELRPGSYALVLVSDDGAGMSAETLSQAFDPFFTTKGPERGTGLGLSVVQGITQQHDGYVDVYSELGRGTVFKIYLPIADGPARWEPPAAAHTADLSGDERILVLDDDAHVRSTLERVLARQGYQVASAATQAEAMALLTQQNYDVLVTDVMFGASSGPAVAEAAKALQPNLRTLFMSGYTRHIVPALTGPALLKPFSVVELLTVLRTLL